MRPMIYLAGEGAFATYRAALTAAGAIAVTAADGVPPRRCQGLLLPGAATSTAAWTRRSTP